MKTFTFSVKTMGCKANTYDSLLIEQQLIDLGGRKQSPDEAADVFVLNSCTVTAEADKQCQRELQQVKMKSPGAFTVLTGCYAQVGRDQVAADPKLSANVSAIVDNDGKAKLRRVVAEHFGIPVTDEDPDPEIYWGELPTTAGRTRSFVKIQEGCNDYCTYCIIPYARGKSRSVRMGAILGEIQRLALAGVREVVLTGTNIADYGLDFGMTLENLIEAILEHTSMPRVRITSLDPTEITDGILRLVGYRGTNGSMLLPHLHVSLQNPVSRVLRAMKRQYRKDEVVDCLNRIATRAENVGGIFVGMDMIAGFPSESLDEHNEGVDTLAKLPWTRLHVFPYSEREGTPAIRIKEIVSIAERKRRAHELLALSHKRHDEFTARWIGRPIDGVLFETLLEESGGIQIMGHAPNYIRVKAAVPGALGEAREKAKQLINTVGRVQVSGKTPKPAQDWTLTGKLIES